MDRWVIEGNTIAWYVKDKKAHIDDIEMTGLGASVVRAALMLIFVLIGKLIDRDANNISLLSFVAFLFHDKISFCKLFVFLSYFFRVFFVFISHDGSP